ncbi:MAG: ATP-dependent Clp protease proteolytic subunit [Flavobacteriales bacterium]|jgi:ATP-dependent protease ClpP protease subunit|nr:ATP-dependent Clp protease proteolytic subunit [Flavobacteriales bacterium]
MKSKFYISVTATSKTEAQVKIKGSISNWRNSSEDFEQKVDELVAKGVNNVTLYINSGGGSVFEANEIANIISKFPGTITAELGAICASAATIIAIKASKITMASNGQFMIHRPMVGVQGNEDELSSALKLLQTLQDNFLDQYAAKTGMSKETIADLWKTDYWMDAKEAKSKGFVDAIIGESENPDVEDIQALLSEKVYQNIPEALVAFAINPQSNTNQIKNTNMKVIALSLGLTPNANEQEVQAAITSLKAKADKADVYKTELDNLKETVQNEKVDTLIESAVKAKKINANQKELYKKAAKNDFDTTKAMLENMQATVVVSDHIEAITDSSKTLDDYTPSELEAMAENSPEAYDALVKKYTNS